MFQRLGHDLAYALRGMRRRPGFTAVAVLSLALGIGANTAVFALVNAVFLRSLPVEDMDRLVAIFSTEGTVSSIMTYFPTSFPNFEDYRDENDVLSDLVAYVWIPLTLSSGDQATILHGLLTTGNYFDVLGVEPAVGRTFRPEELGTDGSPPVVVLSHGLWSRRFGADPSIIGSTIRLNDLQFTVVGVAPAGFKGTETFKAADFWVPMGLHEQVFSYDELFWQRDWMIFSMFGRLAPGVNVQQAQQEMASLSSRLSEAYPDKNEALGVRVFPQREASINPYRRHLYVLTGLVGMAIVGLVLLVACTNVANLLLARSLTRRREVAMRLALGARRRHLVQQLLVESLVLSLLGASAGLLLAFAFRAALWRLRLPDFPLDALDLGFDARVMLFTAAIALVTAFLFGLVPALQSSRPDLVQELRDRQGNPAGGRRPQRTRELLVAAQIALALVTLSVAGLFVRSMFATQRVDPGFDTHRLMVATLNTKSLGLEADGLVPFYRRLVDHLERSPGIDRVALSETTLLDLTELLRTVVLPGHQGSGTETGFHAGTTSVTPGYFATAGIELLSGRDFRQQDRQGSQRVAIVNQTAAARLWPGENPLGREFQFGNESDKVRVIATVRDIKYNFLDEEPRPYIYLPLLQEPSNEITIHVAAAGRPETLLRSIQREVRELDPSLTLTDVKTAQEVVREALWPSRMTAMLLLGFASVALILAVVGSYGMMAFATRMRTREIGLRMALGAERRRVLNLLLRRVGVVALTGSVIGLVLSVATGRLVANLLFGISPTDLGTFFVAALVICATLLLACLVPALRASSVMPARALRYEE